ncbi:transglutaminase family protein [Humisphaera borealis]|uniref:Transglutaminase family protein n=1 Tax=Humisphaera borealis TaxID=2807512 RepID=A0A7M2X0N7_9BACT|nr:transglutaminase family protein [Humisphaera borealis]QOV91253.1 transglutaminase family protein [Humisphaera borealis]
MPRQSRRLRIRHTTRYTYDRPVARSVHRLHIRPLTDMRQTLMEHTLTISEPAQVIEYEDVFGNRAARFELTSPYTELTVTAESLVDVEDIDPFAFASVPIRPSFPLVWMPAERLMLSPYLLPDELPDTQLKEIYDYAMTFVERNNRDLMETLFAINLSLHRDYKYSPGSTSLETSAFDVFLNKAGVCQDLSNLFIMMARLLGIPARYVCGYIHTGNAGENRIGADASHAWVQLYIPNVGWKGFDPTNGTLPHLDHVRIAYGRHYRDTAPTEGTLYSPAAEVMAVDVEVREVAPAGANVHPAPAPPMPLPAAIPEVASPAPAPVDVASGPPPVIAPVLAEVS